MPKQKAAAGSDFKGNKTYLPSKPCSICGKTMTWRRSWARNWSEVKYCSERCRRAARRAAGQGPA